MTPARKLRWIVGPLGLVAACAVLAPAGTSAQSTGPVSCPGTFTVLHNDRIGQASFPAGRYEITVRTPSTLSCQDASRQFADFLRRFDGRLPGGWRLNSKGTVFRRSGSAGKQAFRVTPADGQSEQGGSGNGTNTTRSSCPTFRVLNNDRVGSLPIPAGNYVITVKNMSCPAASQQFRQFLQKPSGNLGGGWTLRPRRAKFKNAQTGESFRIKRAPRGGGNVG